MTLHPYEKELRGNWYYRGGTIQEDEICERIKYLISYHLIEIGIDESGWCKLYQDPRDNRYWELSYPESEMHGGGAALLSNVSLQEVFKKYQL